MRRFPILPTLVTLGNLVCGFFAIGNVLIAQSTPDRFDACIVRAGWLIFLAMVFDALDGKLARMANATSDFGAQLDSLCDMVSFGVAPALIIRALAGKEDAYERVAWAASIFFVVCVALRLARFNVETEESEESHQSFNGLPSPAAAGFVAALAILYHKLRLDPSEFAGFAETLKPMMTWALRVMPVLSLLLSLLMVSHVQYPHLVNRLLRVREPLPYLIRVILLVILLYFLRPFSLSVVLAAYVLWGVVGYLRTDVLTRLPFFASRRSGERE